jgi:predicted O-methyltransferase YrrM
MISWKKYLEKFLRRLIVYLSDKANSISYHNLDPSPALEVNKFIQDMKFIPGMISDEQAKVLIILSLTAQQNGDIVEIGSWLGKSTVFLAKGCQISGMGRVFAIDTFKGNPGKESMYSAPLKFGESIYTRFRNNVKKAGLEGYVKSFRMTSISARKKLKTKARLIYIDARHDYLYVSQDISLWSELLVPGGFIIFDDYSPDFPGVVRAVKESIIDSGLYKPLFLIDSTYVAQKI